MHTPPPHTHTPSRKTTWCRPAACFPACFDFAASAFLTLYLCNIESIPRICHFCLRVSLCATLRCLWHLNQYCHAAKPVCVQLLPLCLLLYLPLCLILPFSLPLPLQFALISRWVFKFRALIAIIELLPPPTCHLLPSFHCLEFCLMSAIFNCSRCSRYSSPLHLFSAHTPRGRVCLHYRQRSKCGLGCNTRSTHSRFGFCLSLCWGHMHLHAYHSPSSCFACINYVLSRGFLFTNSRLGPHAAL